MLSRLSVSELPAVYFDGEYRVLGCLPSANDHGFPLFGATHRVVPRDQWVEIDLSHYGLPILNQGSTSSCVGHGASSAMALAWLQGGREKIKFSPWFLYGLINGGRDQGAMISDSLKALKTTGVCPDSDVPAGTMYRNQFSQEAFKNAARYKIFEAYQCKSFDEICSAITLGFPVPLGIMVGNNFSKVDSEGVAPLPNGGGGGHCILGVGLKKSSKYGWVVKIQNSWGANFGINGHCYLQERAFSYMNPDAFAIQALFDDPNDNTPADEVPVATLHFAHQGTCCGGKCTSQ